MKPETDPLNSIISRLQKAAPAQPAGFEERIFNHSRVLLKNQHRKNRFTYTLAIAAVLLIAAGSISFFYQRMTEPLSDKSGWNFVLGDAANSRHSESDALPTRVNWTAQLPGASGVFRPLAWKNLIIVSSGNGVFQAGSKLVALDAMDGGVKWSLDFNSGDFYKSRRFPDRCIQQEHLYLTDGEKCLVIAPLTGQLLKKLSPPVSANGWNYLSASNGKIFGLSRNGKLLFCINPDDGQTLWSKPLPSPSFIPALSKEQLYCHLENGEVISVNCKNGNISWQKEVRIHAKSSVHIYRNTLAILGENDSLAVMDLRTRTLRFVTQSNGLFSAGLALGGSSIILKGGLLAFSAEDGTQLWNKSLPQSSLLCSAPTLLKNHLLTTSGMIGGSLKVLTTDGTPISFVHAQAGSACDGAIVVNNRVFTVGGGKIIAFGCGS